MAEPFKNLVNPESVGRIGDAVAAVDRDFDRAAFVAAAAEGLDALELKARVIHVATQLRRGLPADWRQACPRLVAALPPPHGAATDTGAFWLWPVLTAVELFGLDHPVESLAALRQMTRRFSAEFAVRPFLVRHPDLAWEAIDAWSVDPDPHVRRCASEGSRPRLPWGVRLVASVADPGRGLAVLDRLVDDPSPVVRRSVANHLGDVAKDHPERAIQVAQRWLAERADRRPLVRHALRGPLKKGLPSALALFGEASGRLLVSELAVDPPVASVGDSFTVTATIVALEPCRVRVDVIWSWPGARADTWSEKTFRGPIRDLAEGERWTASTTLSTRPVTTRPLRPGAQRLSVRVNGVRHGELKLTLR